MTASSATLNAARGVDEIQAWIVAQVSDLLGVEPAAIDVRQALSFYGLSSAEAAMLAGDLEAWLGRSVPVSLAWDHPTIERMARHLADEGSVPTPEARRVQPPDVDELLAEIEGLSDETVQILSSKKR